MLEGSEGKATTPEPILIREIHTKEDPAFLQAMELYVESFPRDEREPIGYFVKRCDPLDPKLRQRTVRNHLIVAEHDSHVVAMRYCSFDPEGGWGFFVYITVDPAVRKGGVATLLLDYSKELLRLDALATGSQLKAVFFECERVCNADGPEQEAERVSRLAFFDRREGRIVSGTYAQPGLREGDSPLPLNLMAYFFDDGLDRAEMVRGFYSSFMGIEEGDPLVVEALNGVSDERPR